MKETIALLVIFAVAIYNNAIKALSDKQYSSATIMIYSSAFSILFIFLYGLFSKNKWVAGKSLKPHLIRIITNGFGIFFLFSSYKYLTASSVALVQRMDIPILIMMAVIRGKQKSSLQFWLSFWTIFLFGFLITNSKIIDEDVRGFGLAFLGVLFLSAGYLILKKGTENESIISISLIYCFSILIGGIAAKFYLNELFIFPSKDIWIFALSGLIFSFMILAGIFLLKNFEVEKARLPFIIGTLVTMIFEMIIKNKFFSASQIGLSVLIVGIITTICLNPTTPKINANK